APRQLDQRVDAGARDAGDHRAVMRPDPAVDRQRVGGPRPALPLVFQRYAGMRHRPPLWQEDVLDRPVKAAAAAQSGHIPAARNDPRFAAGKDPAPVDRLAFGAKSRPFILDHLKTPQHPGALLTAAAEAPAAAD